MRLFFINDRIQHLPFIVKKYFLKVLYAETYSFGLSLNIFLSKLHVNISRKIIKMAGVTPLDHNQSLKDALIESLTAILSPDHATRINGEEQVKALEVTEGKNTCLIVNISGRSMKNHKFG